MSKVVQPALVAQDKSSIKSLSWHDWVWVRVLFFVLLVALLGALAWRMAYREKPQAPGSVVVAARDLKPYQRLKASDLAQGYAASAASGTVLTDAVGLIGHAILVQAVDKGEVVMAETITRFSPSVALTDTVLLSVPLPSREAITSALEPGLSVLAIGSAVSDTMAVPVYSTTVLLVDVTDAEVVLAVKPEVAAQLSFYVLPWARVILAPAVDR